MTKKVFPRALLISPRISTQRIAIANALLAQQKKNLAATPTHPLIFGAEFIGSGYDIFHRYGSAESIKLPVFDFSKATAFGEYSYQGAGKWSVPQPVHVATIGATERDMRSGATIREFSSSLSVDAGLSASFLGFGGEVKANYSSTEWHKSQNYFTDFSFRQSLYSLRLDTSSSAARALLGTAAKQAIESGSPDKLFDLYGTHVLSGCVMGGALQQLAVTNVTEYKSTTSIKVAAEASFDWGLLGASANLSVASKAAASEFELASDDNVEVIGGSSPFQAMAYGSGFEKWTGSIVKAPVMVGFTPNTTWAPLTPIWTLASKASRQTVLKNAFADYCKKKAKDIDLFGPLLAELQVIHGETSGVTPPGGFKKIDVDLNKGAGGEFMYLCCQQMSKVDMEAKSVKPITDVAIVFGENAAAPAGYTKLGVDLNKSVGGDFIYLCYRRGAFENAIRGLIIVHGNDGSVMPAKPYVRIAKDLNKGAGGEWIYLCYTKV
jgi:hypothetical protein